MAVLSKTSSIIGSATFNCDDATLALTTVEIVNPYGYTVKVEIKDSLISDWSYQTTISETINVPIGHLAINDGGDIVPPETMKLIAGII